MDREGFQWLVVKAMDSLPEEFRTKLENIDVVVEDWPTQGQLAEAGLRRGQTLLGFYESVPLTKQGSLLPRLPLILPTFPCQHPLPPLPSPLSSLDTWYQVDRL